jgi:glycosyltransferase involved in cell wall biosynthesis
VVERNLSFGFLSSFPPTQCGMATFTTALGSALVGQHSQVHVVRVLDEPEISPPSRLPVVGELVASDSSSYIRAARALNFNDVALIQHEYGLYGGLDGADIMKVLDRLTIPAIAILHTVLPRPTRHQVEVLNRVIEAASAVVVMTDRAQQTLMDIFTVRDDDVRVIPHGATIFNSPPSRDQRSVPHS